MSKPVLCARDLKVRIGRREIVRGISFDVGRSRLWGSSANPGQARR